MNTHIMLDLETMGTRPDAAIGENIASMNDRATTGHLEAINEANRLRVQRDELLTCSETFDEAINAAIGAMTAQKDELLAALKEAATSLETISKLSGRKTFGQPPIETDMEDFIQVRGYANSRMTVARAAIAKAEGGAA